MASPCRVVEDEPPVAQNQPVAPQEVDSNHVEYDFVEQPSQDFFCPVTLELLINPHQTTCCGNHLSQEAVSRLQRDGKPCPMCNEVQLVTMPDKFYKRRVSEVKVRCPYKKSGCEWVGEVGSLQQHSQSCPKRPWQCQYCDLVTTYDIGTNEHIPKCTKYPEPCPNSCEIGTVPRCDVEKHKMVCPLETVSCGYADVGCDVKVCRRDLARHMEEGQQQHLLSATLLNLRLTRENAKEKERLSQIIEEKDRQLFKKDQHIKEMEGKIDELHGQLKAVQHELESKVTTLQQQVVKYGEDTQEHLKEHTNNVRACVCTLQGFTYHEFTLREFSKCQAKGGCGDWYSEPFYSPPQGYKFKLNIETNGGSFYHGICMRAWLKLKKGDYDDQLRWPVNVTAHIQLVNQLGDHNHYEATSKGNWSKTERENHSGGIQKYIELSELGLNATKKTHYLKDDCLHFRVYFKAES